MKDHPLDSQLALFAGGDLEFLERFQVRWHVRGCARCRNAVASHRNLREILATPAGDADLLPSNWDRLSEEMTANIRLGLSAAECIGPSRQERAKQAPVAGGRLELIPRSWIPALAGFGLCLISAGAFWLNTPAEQKRTLARAWDAMTHGGVPQNERGLVLEASQIGLEMKQDGRALITVRNPRPATMSASLEGSIRAGYVDDETGQVTYTNVYSGQ
jgi:hypothetical protein